MIAIMVIILGLVVGSFLNVCIYRVPKKESIVMPGSHCVNCNKPIPWYDNVPLLSFIILGGKCRFCKKKISFIYFIVEILTAVVFLLLFMHFGLTVKFAVFAVIVSALIVASFIDMKIMEIPDEITLTGIVLGPILCFIFPSIIDMETGLSGLAQSAKGLLAGGLLTYLMGLFGMAVFKKEAMGGGDVKLMAMLGAFMGWKLIILAFFIAPFFGSVIGIITKLKRKEEMIPYGPHLSLAAVIVLLWGDEILSRLFLFY